MKRTGVLFGLTLVAAVGAGPLVNVPKYSGKFMWIKVGTLPPTAAKTLTNSHALAIELSFPHDVKLKRDASGHTWFTFILADQGSDWKWHQTTGNAGVPVRDGVIRGGNYTVLLPVTGLSKMVLHDKKQTISLGPNTSGLVGPASFSVVRIQGR